jgi:phage tail sheath gpL-like
MSIFGSLSQNNVVLTSHTLSDTNSIVNNIGVLGVWANSSTFGTSATIGQADNGIDFTNIKIEFIPEPTSAGLLIGGLVVVSRFLRRRVTA